MYFREDYFVLKDEGIKQYRNIVFFYDLVEGL